MQLIHRVLSNLSHQKYNCILSASISSPSSFLLLYSASTNDQMFRVSFFKKSPTFVSGIIHKTFKYNGHMDHTGILLFQMGL